MQIKRRLRTMRAVAFVTYKEWAAYRSHSLVSLFVGPVFFLSQVFIWRALYAGRDTLGGMTLDQILTYFALVTLTGYLTMDFADWNLQMLIRTGKFTTFMLRPIHHRFFALSQKPQCSSGSATAACLRSSSPSPPLDGIRPTSMPKPFKP